MSVVVYFIQLIGGGWDEGSTAESCPILKYLHNAQSIVPWRRGVADIPSYNVPELSEDAGGQLIIWCRYIYCCLHHAACSCTDVELLGNCTMCICWILK